MRKKFGERAESEAWKKFWNYFEKTWINSFKFDWSFFGKTDLSQLTNNALERHNRELKEVVG